jgi:hypothetical protein
MVTKGNPSEVGICVQPSARLLVSDFVRLKLLPRSLSHHPIYENTRSAGLLLNLSAQSRFGRFGRRLGVTQPGTFYLHDGPNSLTPIGRVVHARFIPFGRRERSVEFWITGVHDEFIGRFANVRKFDLPGVVQAKIEHAIAHALERCLLRVPPFIEQFNRIALRFSAHDREITVGPPTEVNCHEQRLAIYGLDFITASRAAL